MKIQILHIGINRGSVHGTPIQLVRRGPQRTENTRTPHGLSQSINLTTRKHRWKSSLDFRTTVTLVLVRLSRNILIRNFMTCRPDRIRMTLNLYRICMTRMLYIIRTTRGLYGIGMTHRLYKIRSREVKFTTATHCISKW